MAPVRLSSAIIRHRKSSASTLASIANIKTAQSSTVTFAPNVTPITYVEDALAEEGSPPALTAELLADASLFPPGSSTSSSFLGDIHARRSHGARKKGADYIPRPPNAFMLFRADFVKQRHVPGSIESTHGSLSKIIGTCWRHLPHEEKHVWEIKAKHAKAEHKARYPNYRFRPVHSKTKKAQKPQASPAEEARCESVARLLLEGKKGDELTREVRALDDALTQAQAAKAKEEQQQLYAPVASRYAPYPITAHRRSSSVPPMLTGSIALPSVRFLDTPQTTQAYPVAHQQPMIRRPSSVPPIPPMDWFNHPQPQAMQSGMDSPLPEPDTSMFNQAFFGASPFQSDHAFIWQPTEPPAPHMMMQPPALDFSFQEHSLAPHELPTPASATVPTPGFSQPAFDMAASSSYMPPSSYLPVDFFQHQHQQAPGSSPGSDSPAPSEHELYTQYQPTFYAPEVSPMQPSDPLLLAPEFGTHHVPLNAGGVEFVAGLFEGAPHVASEDPAMYPKFSASEYRMSTFDNLFAA